MRVKVDCRELKQFRDRLEKLQEGRMDSFQEQMVRELAARLLRKVVQRTPVGMTTFQDILDDDGVVKTHSRGKKKGQIKERVSHTGGGLRRNWQVGKVQHFGGYFVVEVFNQTEYASYVEFGHRQTPGRYVPALGKRLKKAWVPGKFMLTISEKELEGEVDQLIEKRLTKLLQEVFDG